MGHVLGQAPGRAGPSHRAVGPRARGRARHRREHRNPLFLGDVDLPESLAATGDLAEALTQADAVVSAVPTQLIRQVFADHTTLLARAPMVVTVSKGIEAGTLQTPQQILVDMGVPADRVVALSGPSFAREVAARLPTAVVVAGVDRQRTLDARDLFSTDRFRVFSDDVISVELGGALKNVVAIAAGVAHGLSLGHNTHAAIVTRGLAEITRLGVAQGGDPLTFAGLSGMGDLVLTCTGDLSRNRSVGVALGQGRSLEQISGPDARGRRRRAHQHVGPRPRLYEPASRSDHRAGLPDALRGETTGRRRPRPDRTRPPRANRSTDGDGAGRHPHHHPREPFGLSPPPEENGRPPEAPGRNEAMTVGLDPDTLAMVLDAIGMFAHGSSPMRVLIELDARRRLPRGDRPRACAANELGVSLLFIHEDVRRHGRRRRSTSTGCARCMAAHRPRHRHRRPGHVPRLRSRSRSAAPRSSRPRWLGPLAEEGLLMAYGATEPEAGSDLAAMKTVADADRRGRRDGRLQDHRQQAVDLQRRLRRPVHRPGPGAGRSDLVRRRTGHRRVSRTASPRTSTAFGLEHRCASSSRRQVDADRVVGLVEGQGLVQAQPVFGYTRLMVAAFGLGAGWAALDRAIAYSTSASRAVRPLSEKQGYTHKLIVPHAVRLEAGRAYIEETATRIDAGEGALNTEGAIAKYLATEAGNTAAEAAIQAFGGYGYTHEYMVEKIKRDVRITTIYEGTSEIMEMTISRDRWQLHLKTRGRHYHDRRRPARSAPRAPTPRSARARRPGAARASPNHGDARVGRLTRNQHLLFRLGELVAYAEGAAALSGAPAAPRRSAREGRPTLHGRRRWRGWRAYSHARQRPRWPRRASAG